jgi:hypothetical protein
MSRFFVFHALFCMCAVAVGYFLLGSGSNWHGFTYGLGVFCLNMGLLIVLVKWVFSLVSTTAEVDASLPRKGRRIREILIMGFLVVVK